MFYETQPFISDSLLLYELNSKFWPIWNGLGNIVWRGIILSSHMLGIVRSSVKHLLRMALIRMRTRNWQNLWVAPRSRLELTPSTWGWPAALPVQHCTCNEVMRRGTGSTDCQVLLLQLYSVLYLVCYLNSREQQPKLWCSDYQHNYNIYAT